MTPHGIQGLIFDLFTPVALIAIAYLVAKNRSLVAENTVLKEEKRRLSDESAARIQEIRELSEQVTTFAFLVAWTYGESSKLEVRLRAVMSYSDGLERRYTELSGQAEASHEDVLALIRMLDIALAEVMNLSAKLAKEKKITAILAGLQEVLSRLRTALTGLSRPQAPAYSQAL